MNIIIALRVHVRHVGTIHRYTVSVEGPDVKLTDEGRELLEEVPSEVAEVVELKERARPGRAVPMPAYKVQEVDLLIEA